MPPLCQGRRAWVLALLLAALTFAVFSLSARNGFVDLDDPLFITENSAVRRGLSAPTALWALKATENANWFPVTRLSHLADVSLFGMRAGAHHLVSAAWHAAAAAFLFLALLLLTGAQWRSLAAAAIFAVHPLQVESVAWAAERSMVLAGFFSSLTLLLWVRHVRRPGAAGYGAVLLSFAIGLAAKPVLVTLPFLLLLLDLWPLGRLGRQPRAPWRPDPARFAQRLLEKGPLFALSAASATLTLITQKQDQTVMGLPAAARLGNAATSYCRYLGKMLWPVDLAVFYPLSDRRLFVAQDAAAGLLLAALTVLAALQVRRRPWFAVGWLWYLGTLVPMIGLVQVGSQALADRYAYLPLAGVALAAVWLAADGLRVLRWRSALSALLAVTTIFALAAATAAQVGVWRDSRTLFTHTLASTARNWFVENALGATLHVRGDLGAAEELYRVSIRDLPNTEAHYNLGRLLFERRRYDEAAEHFREAIRLKPDYPRAHNNLGVTLVRLRHYGEAEFHCREALRLQPDYAGASSNLRYLLSLAGRSSLPGPDTIRP